MSSIKMFLYLDLQGSCIGHLGATGVGALKVLSVLQSPHREFRSENRAPRLMESRIGAPVLPLSWARMINGVQHEPGSFAASVNGGPFCARALELGGKRADRAGQGFVRNQLGAASRAGRVLPGG